MTAYVKDGLWVTVMTIALTGTVICHSTTVYESGEKQYNPILQSVLVNSYITKLPKNKKLLYALLYGPP